MPDAGGAGEGTGGRGAGAGKPLCARISSKGSASKHATNSTCGRQRCAAQRSAVRLECGDSRSAAAGLQSASRPCARMHARTRGPTLALRARTAEWLRMSGIDRETSTVTFSGTCCNALHCVATRCTALQTATISRVRRTAALPPPNNGNPPLHPIPRPRRALLPRPAHHGTPRPTRSACAQRMRSMCMGNRPPALKPAIAAESPQSYRSHTAIDRWVRD